MEHLVPLHREDWSFFDRQRKVFADMFKDTGMQLAEGGDEWKAFDQELEKIKKEMFTLSSDFGSSSMIKPERPIVADAEGNKRLSLRFDCKDFKPEEISVKTIDNKLMVHAKHVEESPGRKVYKEFTRQYVLPQKIDPMTLDSTLASDGVLSIEAPAPEAVEAARERVLPIKRL